MNHKMYLIDHCVNCPNSYCFVTTKALDDKEECLSVFCKELERVCDNLIGIDSECPLLDKKDTQSKLIEVDDSVEELKKNYYELKGRYEQLKKDYDDLKSLRSFPIDELPFFEKKSVPYYIDAIGDKPPFDSGVE